MFLPCPFVYFLLNDHVKTFLYSPFNLSSENHLVRVYYISMCRPTRNLSANCIKSRVTFLSLNALDCSASEPIRTLLVYRRCSNLRLCVLEIRLFVCSFLSFFTLFFFCFVFGYLLCSSILLYFVSLCLEFTGICSLACFTRTG